MVPVRHSSSASGAHVAARFIGFALIAFSLACSADRPTAVVSGRSPDHALEGKSPSDPTVRSASPDSASQGVTLDVHVFGTGFTTSASATWLLGGVADANKVRTNTTTVISSTELVANITIADIADVASWDVQVMLVGGKKGIGTELFVVTSKPNSAATGTPPSGARWTFGALGTTIDAAGTVTLQPAGIYGDGLDVSGVSLGSTPPVDAYAGSVSGDYQDTLCGLALRVYWWNSLNGSGDGTLDPSLSTASTCPGRVYRVAVGSSTWSVWGFMYLWEIMQLPLNGSRRQVMRIRVEQPNCTRLLVGTPVSDTDFTATSGGVRVTRVAGTSPTTHLLSALPGYMPGEWLVESVDGKAACQYQKGQRWVTASNVTGLYFRIHVTEIPPTL